MSTRLPAHINEHRPDEHWNCTWCGLPPEPWPCKKLRETARAYFLTNPADLLRFMAIFLDRALRDPAFRDMAAHLVQARFIGWIDPALAAQRQVERARKAVGRVKSFASNLAASILTPRGLVRVGRPLMGQPVEASAEGRR